MKESKEKHYSYEYKPKGSINALSSLSETRLLSEVVAVTGQAIV